MDTTDRSGKLVVVEVRWEQKPENGWLLRQVFDLLLQRPDLTPKDTPFTMPPEGFSKEEGGER